MSDKKSASEDLSQIAPGVFHTKILFVNAYFVDTPEAAPNSFVLVDTGLPFASTKILGAVEKRYGAGGKPSAGRAAAGADSAPER